MQIEVRKLARWGVLASLCLLTAAVASAHPGGHGPAKVERTPGPPTTVAFYEVEGCPICAKINSWLDELEKRYPGAATIVRKPVTDAAAAEEMHARGIEHHGVAMVNPSSGVVWVEQAHVLTRETLEAKFRAHVVDDRVIRRGELACGSCIYGMDGVMGCVAATRVDGEPMLLTGVEVAAHDLGLCGGAKLGRVAGHVEDGKFVATFVELD